jgi:hypothetical protein
MSTFLSTSIAPQIDVSLLRRDYFDGVSFLLQDSDLNPIDLTNVTLCSSIWRNTTSGTFEQVTSFNIRKEEPLRAGQVHLWLSSAQTGALWDAAQYTVPSGVFFPSAYSSAIRPFFRWDLRMETQEYVADLVSVLNGTFVTQTNHEMGATERVIFTGANVSTINYNGTGARIYSNLTNISYLPPYTFTVPALSGVTDAAIGGSVYRLKQDTVVAGIVNVASTVSNCFP